MQRVEDTRMTLARRTGRSALVVVGLVAVGLAAGPAVAAPPLDRTALAAEAKAQFLHAWRGYERYAWGHDELQPLSKTPRDWYGETLLTTPIDALDALILLGLEDEAKKDHAYVLANASFDKDVSVKTFEITIRLLGGLLAGHQLSGDPKLLALADDLGGRLLKAFDSPTGLPWTYVNLKTGAVREPITNPAEAGTLLLEFGTLSRLTGKPAYYDKPKKALVAVYERRSKIGLVGTAIDVRTGEWTERESHLSGRIDSYYEYLLKAWKLFGDEDCRRMWETHRAAIHHYLADEVRGELWYGYADMDAGRRTRSYYGALDAFFPAVLVLDGDLDRAKRLQESGFRMWQLHGLEPEVLDYREMKVVSGEYHLRPEIIESAYYLHRKTGDARYLEMGRVFLEGLVKHCRTEAGFAAIKDVRTMEKTDAMESFLFAETLKYLYLLFAPDSAFDLDAHVLTTEAHPLKPVGATSR
jgi:mannosidase alpha-like ER degradation enhancer 2